MEIKNKHIGSTDFVKPELVFGIGINVKVESFPANIIANSFGFKEMELFQTANDAEKQPVSVKF